MTKNDYIDSVIEILETRGWCQGRLCDAEGRLCAIGAVLETDKRLIRNLSTYCPDPYHRSMLYYEVRRELDGKMINESLQRWNDTPGRTKEEVTELFESIKVEDRELVGV